MSDASEKLREIIQEAKKEIWAKEYQAEASDAETLGVIISQYFEWGGESIAETAYAAFEDANFHSLNEKFVELCHSEDLLGGMK